MKFGKLLQSISSDAPDMEGMFVRYKLLKKLLKLIKPAEQRQGDNEAAQRPQLSDAIGSSHSALLQASAGPCPAEQEFINTLNEDLDKINEFFMEREEESVIRLQVLEDRLNDATTDEELQAVRKAFADFHGEIVLLLHWSVLNYAAVAKILKKHDKVTGGLLKEPYLCKVLHQPFCSTDAISALAKTVEDKMQDLAKADGTAKCGSDVEEGPSDAIPDSALDSESLTCLRRTRAALGVWDTLGKNAATPSTVAVLPPALAAVQPTPKRQRTS